jgi:hypothetical protein
MPPVRLNPAIQFFASPAEFGGWVCEWVSRYALHSLFAKSFFRSTPPKFEARLDVPWDDAGAVAEVIRTHHVLYLSLRPLTAEVANINLLPRANPDQLHINLPGLSDRGLGSLSLGSVSQVAESIKVYRAVARDVLARTAAGVWFRQQGRKKVHLDDRMRYSPGAALLMAQGIPLCGAGRMVVGRLGLPRTQAGRRAEPPAAPDPARESASGTS